MRRIPLPSIATAIAVAALLTATTGASYAGGILTGKQIKNHSIGLVDLQKSAVKKLEGSKGPRGKKGATGKQGPRGLTGAAASSWHTGHVTSLGGTMGTTDYFAPIGASTATASTSEFVDELGPDPATTITGLSVVVQNAPNPGSERVFYFVVNHAASPNTCIVVAGASSCTVALNLALGAQTFYVEGDVLNGNAGGSDAAFSWTTSG